MSEEEEEYEEEKDEVGGLVDSRCFPLFKPESRVTVAPP